MGEDLETLVLIEREPLQASLGIPCVHHASFDERAVIFIYARCFICSLEVAIPFRMETVVDITDHCQILDVLSHRWNRSQ